MAKAKNAKNLSASDVQKQKVFGITVPIPAKGGKKEKAPEPLELTIPWSNILPASVMETVAERDAKRKVILVGVGVVAVMAAAWLAQAAQIQFATNQLNSEKSTTTELNRDLTALAPVKSFYAEVDGRLGTIQKSMTSEILYSEVLAELSNRTPAGVGITSFSLSVSADAGNPESGDAGAAGCPNPDPYSPVKAIGCISFSGEAQSRAAIGNLIDSLLESEMLTSPYVPSANTSDGTYNFSGTVALSPGALKGRYNDPAFVTKVGTP